MQYLKSLNKYFWKYRTRFILGIIFVILSNYFRILTPQISRYVVDKVQKSISAVSSANTSAVKVSAHYNYFVQLFINKVESGQTALTSNVVICGITLIVLSIIGGFFMFLMRQTIIVMSRHIEYEQKNEIYQHYQKLDVQFYKTHSTGDLMNRISEDVSRVRMYTGPSIMYLVNLASTIGFCLFFMFSQSWQLTVYVLLPLPILAIIIYYVNAIIHTKSEKIQALLSDLTTTAQESYSGIRVIKSFVQEKATLHFFAKNSETYKKNAIGLSKVEAIYFPSIALLIGLSNILTIAIGSYYATTHQHNITAGTITEFVMYVNMLTFPVSAIGWTAGMIQRASASQKRINEFLQTAPTIKDERNLPAIKQIGGDIVFDKVEFVYPHTGIRALHRFSLALEEGKKLLVLGKTGSGKSTIAQLLLHFYNPTEGKILIGENNINDIPLQQLRDSISYVPQDVFLFSDSVANNIVFSDNGNSFSQENIQQIAQQAAVHKEILGFSKQYDTVVGERGVTLSGGQKQRIAIARALIKQSNIIVFDDCLSAVDAKTEHLIANNLAQFLQDRTAIFITHRILTAFNFDKIIVLENGTIIEEGTHETLLQQNGYYTELYNLQLKEETNEEEG